MAARVDMESETESAVRGQGRADGPQSSGLVPFPRLSAVVGYLGICLLLFAVALELFSYVALKIYDRNTAGRELQRFGAIACRGTGAANCRPRAPIDVVSASPVFDGQPWAEEMWREFRVHNSRPDPYVSFLGWRNQDFKGQYLNIDATAAGEVRRTISPPSKCASGKPFVVWTLGGSAMFGYYTPDEFTLASFLAKRLKGRNPCVEVVNLAVPGYNTNQELLQLTLTLKQGLHPDAVVFFDGYNDAFAGTYEGVPWAEISYPQEVANRAGSGSPLQSLRNTHIARLAGILFRGRRAVAQDGGLLYPPVGAAEMQRRVRETMDNYDANRRTARALAKTYGFAAYFFWQPSLLYSSKPLVPFERAVIDYHSRSDLRGLGEAVRALFQEVEQRARAGADFVYLGAIFDRHPEALYVDEVHLGPQGYAVLADAIADVVSTGPPQTSGEGRSER